MLRWCTFTKSNTYSLSSTLKYCIRLGSVASRCPALHAKNLNLFGCHTISLEWLNLTTHTWITLMKARTHETSASQANRCNFLETNLLIYIASTISDHGFTQSCRQLRIKFSKTSLVKLLVEVLPYTFLKQRACSKLCIRVTIVVLHCPYLLGETESYHWATIELPLKRNVLTLWPVLQREPCRSHDFLNCGPFCVEYLLHLWRPHPPLRQITKKLTHSLTFICRKYAWWCNISLFSLQLLITHFPFEMKSRSAQNTTQNNMHSLCKMVEATPQEWTHPGLSNCKFPDMSRISYVEYTSNWRTSILPVVNTSEWI